MSSWDGSILFEVVTYKIYDSQYRLLAFQKGILGQEICFFDQISIILNSYEDTSGLWIFLLRLIEYILSKFFNTSLIGKHGLRESKSSIGFQLS